jgi:hypothetical protein
MLAPEKAAMVAYLFIAKNLFHWVAQMVEVAAVAAM